MAKTGFFSQGTPGLPDAVFDELVKATNAANQSVAARDASEDYRDEAQGFRDEITANPRIHALDTVADMVAAPWLQVGHRVRTAGYYSAGDGGGNEYEIVAAGTGTDDGGSFIDLAGSGLQAKGLFPGGLALDAQYGLYSSAVDDQNVQLSRFLNNTAGEAVFTVDGTIVTDGLVVVNNPSLWKITASKRTTIKAADNSSGAGGLLMTFRSPANVHGLIFDGNTANNPTIRNTVTVYLTTSVNFYGCEFKNCTGIGLIYSESDNAEVVGCKFDTVGFSTGLASLPSTRKPSLNITSSAGGKSKYFVRGCRFYRSGLDAILADNIENISIQEVEVDTCGAAAIYLESVKDFDISSVLASNCAATVSPYSNAIDLPACENGQVRGVVTKNTSGCAVGIFKSCKNVSAIGVTAIDSHMASGSNFDAAVAVSGDASQNILVDHVLSINNGASQAFAVLAEAGTPEIKVGNNVLSSGETVNKLGFKRMWVSGAPGDGTITGSVDISPIRFADQQPIATEALSGYVSATMPDGTSVKLAVVS